MAEVILHHYPQSPVSEKVRVALGIKELDWCSVTIPRLPPKPELIPLTGGYRLTPVMQIGADIYCDSQAILRELERRFPEPSLFPGGADGMVWGVSRWTDGALFTNVIALVFIDAGEAMPAEFWADRGRLYFGADFDKDAIRARLPEILASLRAQLGWMEARAATGRTFMLGDEPGLPDALCYYLLWFIRGRYSEGPEFLSQFPKLCAWEKRVAALGHGNPRNMNAAEALEIAKDATPATPEAVDPGDPLGLAFGDTVEVRPEAMDGVPAVTGHLRFLDPQTVVLDRDDERVGQVSVHFPRIGYRIRRG
ncbi:MAG: glutathione S-transferase family protein [Alphaproteobacteria bacterium]